MRLVSCLSAGLTVITVTAAVLVSSPTGAADPQTFAGPALEPFAVEKVIDFDFPSGVSQGNAAEITPDGEHLIVEIDTDGGSQVAITDLAGDQYRCVTCGVAKSATKVTALEDGKRIWFAEGSSGGTGKFTYTMLECSPSIYDCKDRKSTPVKFPSGGSLLGGQNREAKPDPYGEYVTWNEVSPIEGTRMSIAKLVRGRDTFDLVEQRVFSPAWDKKSDYADDLVDAARFYEGASWHNGGRTLKYQATSTGLNYDIYLLDTESGQRRQLTNDIDYNEQGEIAPDGRTTYFTSARGLDRMTVFTQLVRPPLIDSASFGQIGRVGLWNNRRCMNEPWVMNTAVGQQQGGYSGQPVIIDPAWTIRGWSWFADSARAVVTEQQKPSGSGSGGDPNTPRRTSILHFPTRTPTPPQPPVHQNAEQIAQWSVPVKDFNPFMGRPMPARLLKGKSAGSALLSYVGTYASGTFSVVYKNYSDDGETFIDGFEKMVVAAAPIAATWSADLKSRGVRKGHLRGLVVVGPDNFYKGKVESVINGRELAGIPTQASCPAASQPELVVTAGSGEGQVRVTATVPGDGQARAVRGAVVSTAGATVTTDERGIAVLDLAPGASVTAEAGGFHTATYTVPGN